MDGIEFDLLDPCCQKEIVNERKKKEINQKLRHYDRSNSRLDLCFTVFKNDNGSSSRCSCCPESNYTELASLKAIINQQVESSADITKTIPYDDKVDDDDNDEDDDFEDDFISEFEIQRREEMKKKIEAVMRMQKLGFGVHVEDSLSHLEIFITCGLPIVLHIYSNTKADALLDLHFESISMRYLGTLFRRVPVSSALLQQFSEKYGFNEKGNSRLSNGCAHGIVVFCNGSISCSSFSIDDFVSNTTVYEGDLNRFLDAGKALQFEPDQDSLSLLHYTVNAAAIPDLNSAIDSEEAESFCDDPSCGRKFPHAHVGNGRGITGPKLGEESEVFDKKYFTKI